MRDGAAADLPQGLRGHGGDQLEQRRAILAVEADDAEKPFALRIEWQSRYGLGDGPVDRVAGAVQLGEIGVHLVAQPLLDFAHVAQPDDVARDPGGELRGLVLEGGEGRAERHLEIGGDEQRAFLDPDQILFLPVIERRDRDVPLRLAAADGRRPDDPLPFIVASVFWVDFYVCRGRAALELQIDHELAPGGDLVAAVGALEEASPLFYLRPVARIVAPFLNRPPRDAERPGEFIPGADVAHSRRRRRYSSRRLDIRSAGEQRALRGRQRFARMEFPDRVGDLLSPELRDVFRRELHFGGGASNKAQTAVSDTPSHSGVRGLANFSFRVVVSLEVRTSPKSLISDLKRVSAVDLFCGAGGLTHGLRRGGLIVQAGYDVDPDCKFPYEHNNRGVSFNECSVSGISGNDLAAHYPRGHVRVLVGCAPCQTFSKYTRGVNNADDPKWELLNEFARLITELKPEIVSMENVPLLQEYSIFDKFLRVLQREGFSFSKDRKEQIVYCPDYGIPQERQRLVIIASRLGPIKLLPPTHKTRFRTVREAIAQLPKLRCGEVDPSDPLHRCSSLSEINLKRIRHSKQGGTWRDWPLELVAACHKEPTGTTYPSVYGRMKWERPSPTITTQFYGYGNGRFGHPEQDRAISLREGAILQSFPRYYQFVEPNGRYSFKTIGRLIGNAVPVRIGEIVARTIRKHLNEYGR